MRRRRRLPETYTIVECSHCTNVAGDMTCTNPKVDAFPILVMSTKKNFADTTELVSPSDKALVVDAIKFQAEYHSNPDDWNQCTSPPVNVFGVSFMLVIWEAIVVLPLAQATSNVPAYIPNLTDGFNQVGDTADRVLWKRLSFLPMWGVQVSANFPQITATERDEGHGPVIVKSKVKLDDRHGLFFVRNFVHNIFFSVPPPVSCTLGCVGDPPPGPLMTIPVIDEVWMKVFYHSHK